MLNSFMRSANFAGNLARAPEGVAGGGGTDAGGAAAAAGNLAGAAALAGGAPAGDGSAGGTPPANNTPAGGTPPDPLGDRPWYADLPANFQTAITAKGWNALATKDEALNTVLDSYVNLEKLIGADKAGRTVTLPKDDATPEERAEFFKKIGTPEKPEEYGFDKLPNLPDSVKSALTDAQKWMHEAGVPKMIGENLLGVVAKNEAAKQEAWVNASKEELNKLAVELGAEFDNKTELARRAMRTAGLDGDAVSKIEQAIGTTAMMKMFMAYGENLREAAAPNPGVGGAQFQTTPQAAQQQIANLFLDKDFMANYNSPNPKVRGVAIAKMEELHKIAAGGA